MGSFISPFRRGLLVVFALALLSALAVGGRREPAPDPQLAAGRLPVFRISGSIGRLFPGATRRVTVTLRNPHPFAVVVTSVRASVRRGHPGCGGRYLRVSRYRGHLKIQAHGRARIVVRMGLVRGAPDACQGARFPIRYVGRGRRA